MLGLTSLALTAQPSCCVLKNSTGRAVPPLADHLNESGSAASEAPLPCCVGAASLVNGGGAVGASDLLTAPSEIFETDLSDPVPQLALKVGSPSEMTPRLRSLILCDHETPFGLETFCSDWSAHASAVGKGLLCLHAVLCDVQKL